jgi:hypothetical protein
MATQIKSGYLYGCRGLVITQLNADGSMPGTPDRYGIKTSQKASVEVEYEEGEKSTLRGGDKVLAKVEDRDTITGANVKFTDARFDAKATKIIGGGTLLTSGEEITGWEAPKTTDDEPLPFAAELYTANYNAQGGVDGYIKYSFPFCKGKLPAVEHSDKEWSAPEFEIRGRENPSTAAACYRKEFVASLPVELTS